MQDRDGITAEQRGLTDMSPGDFRDAAHRVADLAADYLDRLEDYDVLPKIAPGETRAKLTGKILRATVICSRQMRRIPFLPAQWKNFRDALAQRATCRRFKIVRPAEASKSPAA